MALSPIGSMNLVNQNMTMPATQLSNEIAKEGFASVMNLNEFNEKEKVVDKLEKVNESQELKEEIKEKQEEEEKKRREKEEKEAKMKAEEEEVEEYKDKENSHRLDISI
ncbi:MULTISPECIES: hypothetical protein [unclassified Campylobacter]|uniref:hypothetical protein n=1 Tax=unclassified Campylobacter TaxID=2593542 RepID=UPI0012382107|nr:MULTISPECIES: hypothetical protein [unclassified Campylobacter]KAA6224577.1 hypothetical protein FMM54_08300 [Campylobacter sp. LR185c]KAA6224924.1 hypothetical protein FMM55_08490 [Campylobacter sp. LR196d]KAA6225421.1 hypothetical protein FMM57_07755 [Campylobacter sp. LR286c]KAA6229125.1 hypothetical protein FMM58_08520 [Campylobacter sp. LR291e]KAA6229609.1 hypothetical protein FMM56_07780 [Campylobacter sp. LR264d]